MKKLPWITKRKKTDPELPLEPPVWLGNWSNGEMFHEATPKERLMRKIILEKADEKSRRLGVDRRHFLASTMGMATSLSVINMVNGCGSDSEGGGGGGGDGGFKMPDAATEDCDLSNELLDTSKEFIFDMQTHHIEHVGPWQDTNPAVKQNFALFFPQSSTCPGDNVAKLECLGFEEYLRLIFLESDTTMAVLSGFPQLECWEGRTLGCGNPLGNEDIVRSRDRLNDAAASQRVVNHAMVVPNDQLPLQLDMMQKLVEDHGVGGWKLYTGFKGDTDGWFLDDEQLGIPVIEKGLELGASIFCVHKGPSVVIFSEEFNDPRDIGVVAKRFPDAKFVVYHSNITWKLSASQEGPWDPGGPMENVGVNAFIKSVIDNGVEPNSNVYAELGTAWLSVMTSTTAAQHLIGKLLKHIGEDNVLWGSECIWFSSPQPQLEAFRSLQISQEFQDMYGYPELTSEIKAKILGLNGARLYGVDPTAKRCQIDQGKLAQAKLQMDEDIGPRRWAFQPPRGPTTRREFMKLVRHNLAMKKPA